jgi:hypothetical protein
VLDPHAVSFELVFGIGNPLPLRGMREIFRLVNFLIAKLNQIVFNLLR